MLGVDSFCPHPNRYEHARISYPSTGLLFQWVRLHNNRGLLAVIRFFQLTIARPVLLRVQARIAQVQKAQARIAQVQKALPAHRRVPHH